MTDKNSFYKEYPNFDWLYYHKNQLHFNIEKDENKVIEHFLKIGKNKKMLYNKNNYYNNFELDNINIGEISKGFDWEYYLKINNDLNKLFETKHEAYNHYIKFGINEKRIKNILEKYEIKQLRTSDCMTHFKDRFKDFYKLKEYEDENINTVYFGVYSTTDINNIKNMKNTKYIIFGGTDVDLILDNKELKKLFDEIDNKIILYISENINDRLKYYGYNDAIKFNLDLTDKNIFKKPESLGDSIFIYNGFFKGLEHLYGKNTYEEIIKRNPNFNYIFSNNLNVKNEEMYNIYKKCFIGLRLTTNDGNANMVKEMECMEIPVIHNHSDYGLKWKNVEDVENLIFENNNKQNIKNIFRYKIAFSTNMFLDWKTYKPTYGGGERYLNNLLDIFKELNSHITIYQLGYENKTIIINNTLTIEIINNFSNQYKEFNIGFSEYVNNQCEKLKYDLIIYFMPEMCCSDNIYKKSILINHGIWFDRYYKNIEYYKYLKLQLDKCSKIICVDTNYINFIRTYWGYNTYNNLIYIPNFINDEFFYIKHLNTKKLNILIPRRANIYRGSKIINYLLNNLIYDVNITWCGSGDDDDELINFSKNDRRFKFIKADFDNMVNLYKQTDIVIIPTLASEGTSLSCIEAMGSSNIVISTNVGGLPNLIIDNYNGFLCNNTQEDITDKLIYVIKNYNKLNYIINNAYNVAKTSFSKQIWSDKIKKIINLKLNDENDENDENDKNDENNKYNKCLKYKIAIITKNCINGGVESIIKEQQKLLDCDVFICNGKIDEKNKPFKYIKNLTNMDDVINSLNHYDIIISNWVPLFAQNAFLYLKDNCKIIEFIHRLDTNDNDKTNIDGIITHSYFIKKEIKNNCNIKNIDVINHPINTKIFKPINKKKNKIALIGSYNIHKGIDLFIKALNNIKNNILIKNYELCIYGKDDGKKNDYINLAKELNININFYDSIKDVNDILNEIELLCIPSYLEGFPVILCEALSCNVKVITSNIIGFKEFYKTSKLNNYNNLFHIINENNENILSNDILKVLNKEIILNNYEGYNYINKYYNLDVYLLKLKKILQKYSNFKIKKNIKFKSNELDIINFDIKLINTLNNTSNKINNINNIKISNDNFLRIYNVNKIEINNLKLLINIIKNNDLLACQLDLLDIETNQIIYKCSEYSINDNIILDINLYKKYKLININIRPYNLLNTINNIKLYNYSIE